MIQRVQSIWLLLTSLTLFLLLLLPIVTKQNNGTELSLMVTGLYQKANGASVKLSTHLPLLITTIAIAVMALVNIFNYKNRLRQKRMVMAIIAFLAGLNFLVFGAAQRIPGGTEGATYGAGLFMPLLAIIWCFFAIRGIRKDEQLIRSADRLR